MPELTPPSERALVNDLRLIAGKAGLSGVDGDNIPSLVKAAQIADIAFTTEYEPEAISALLRQAVDLIGDGHHKDAAPYLYGLTKSTEQLPIGERLKLAAKAYGCGVETFRHEPTRRILQYTAVRIKELIRTAVRDREEKTNAEVSDMVSADPKSSDMPMTEAKSDSNDKRTESRRWRVGIIIPLVGVLAAAALGPFIGWALNRADDGRPIVNITNLPAPVAAPTENKAPVGWGPDRPMFTMLIPSTFATFNSIKDNPVVGDERNFVRVQFAGENEWHDSVFAKPGDKLRVRLWFENSCGDNFIDSPSSWIQGAKARFWVQQDSEIVSAYAILSGDNVRNVWDGAIIRVAPGVKVAIDDIRLRNFALGGNEGAPMDVSEMTTEGTLMGYDKLDGTLKPGYEYAGDYVMTLRVYED